MDDVEKYDLLIAAEKVLLFLLWRDGIETVSQWDTDFLDRQSLYLHSFVWYFTVPVSGINLPSSKDKYVK